MTQRQADLLLLSAAFLWGSSYGLMKLGAETLTPVSIASMRCLLPFSSSAPFS